MNPCKTTNQLNRLSKTLFLTQKTIEIGDIELYIHDLEKLRPNIWLNNKIIMSYINLVKEYFSELDVQIYPLSTFFYKYVKDKNKNFISNSFNEYIQGEYDFIIIPIHLPNHWTLCIIDIKNKIFEYYDSLKGSIEKNLKILQKIKEAISIISHEFSEFYDFEMQDRSSSVPLQDNCSDCGVFCCMYVRHRIENKNIQIKQKNSKIQRYKMLHELSIRKIIYRTDLYLESIDE